VDEHETHDDPVDLAEAHDVDESAGREKIPKPKPKPKAW
jgi:hypothetical protein